jgi:formylglycine-generating enzyme required for sulfatase activity
MKMATNYLQRTGYRLPTEAEWEYVCRAGTETTYSFGEAVDLLGKYAWYAANSSGRSQPVGTVRPNDKGLFDMHGNLLEWCQNVYVIKSGAPGNKIIEDIEDNLTLNRDRPDSTNNRESRVWRGGKFDFIGVLVRSASGGYGTPLGRGRFSGFRPARTIR